jgi:hypothetical protein
MGTHAMIGIWNPETDKVVASYVHYDGYLDGVGKTLINSYNSNLLASMVATGGYLSSLSDDYARDRAEAAHFVPHAEKYSSVEEYLKEGWDYAAASYLYLWDGEVWFAAGRGEKFTDVATLLGRG